MEEVPKKTMSKAEMWDQVESALEAMFGLEATENNLNETNQSLDAEILAKLHNNSIPLLKPKKANREQHYQAYDPLNFICQPKRISPNARSFPVTSPISTETSPRTSAPRSKPSASPIYSFGSSALPLSRENSDINNRKLSPNAQSFPGTSINIEKSPRASAFKSKPSVSPVYSFGSSTLPLSREDSEMKNIKTLKNRPSTSPIKSCSNPSLYSHTNPNSTSNKNTFTSKPSMPPIHSNCSSTPLFKEIKYKIPKLQNNRPYHDAALSNASKTDIIKVPLKVNRPQRKDTEVKRIADVTQLFAPDNQTFKANSSDASRNQKRSENEKSHQKSRNHKNFDINDSNDIKNREKTRNTPLNVPRNDISSFEKNRIVKDTVINGNDKTENKDESNRPANDTSFSSKDMCSQQIQLTQINITKTGQTNVGEKPMSYETINLDDEIVMERFDDQQDHNETQKENDIMFSTNTLKNSEIQSSNTHAKIPSPSTNSTENHTTANYQYDEKKTSYQNNDSLKPTLTINNKDAKDKKSKQKRKLPSKSQIPLNSHKKAKRPSNTVDYKKSKDKKRGRPKKVPFTEKSKKLNNDLSDTSCQNYISQPNPTFTVSGPIVRVHGIAHDPLSVEVINVIQNVSSCSDNITSQIATVKHQSDTIESTEEFQMKMKRLTNFTFDQKDVALTESLISNEVIDSPWICFFCHRGSHDECLGDLFGPYQVSEHHAKEEINSHLCFSPKSSQFTEFGKENKSVVTEVWFHEDCICWNEEIKLIGNSIYGLEKAITTASSSQCFQCHEFGSTICCIHPGCVKMAHFPCAMAGKWHVDGQSYKAYCLNHKIIHTYSDL